jgi:hypothetical protein
LQREAKEEQEDHEEVVVEVKVNVEVELTNLCGPMDVPRTCEAGAKIATGWWLRSAIAREQRGCVTGYVFLPTLPRR